MGETLTSRRYSGQVKYINETKGFAFIDCPRVQEEGFEKDAYVDTKRIKGFKMGDVVQFCLAVNDENQPHAFDLQPAQLCKYYLNGNCNNGSTCHNMHTFPTGKDGAISPGMLEMVKAALSDKGGQEGGVTYKPEKQKTVPC